MRSVDDLPGGWTDIDFAGGPGAAVSDGDLPAACEVAFIREKLVSQLAVASPGDDAAASAASEGDSAAAAAGRAAGGGGYAPADEGPDGAWEPDDGQDSPRDVPAAGWGGGGREEEPAVEGGSGGQESDSKGSEETGGGLCPEDDEDLGGEDEAGGVHGVMTGLVEVLDRVTHHPDALPFLLPVGANARAHAVLAHAV